MTSLRSALAAVSLIALAACESESDPSGPSTPVLRALNEIATAGPLNASSTDTLVYFSFTTGGLVQKTADWDVALRRYEVRLNGGITGTKGVAGYNLQNNKTATDAQVLAFTLENTRTEFDAIRDAQIPDASAFQADHLVDNNIAYANFAGGAPAANPLAYWKVHTADGGYALMRVTSIAYTQTGTLTSITIESRVQSGATLGAVRSVTVPVTSATVAISLVTNAAVQANQCNWDLQVNQQTFAMTVNAACSVGTNPGPASPAFADATAANDASQYGAFLAGIASPIPNSITDPSAPFRYNLSNTNRLHPAFNTYLIAVGTNVYKLQVVNYYSEAGASGYPTLRYARIR